ncbi:hypothetical protein PML25_23135 (plasmid) [Xanthomonas hortorum pv. pelargonii]|uniref:hypothetical protein n=1 Tax=Xanthomonas hortorum TaxID=56454 RepID=UPI00232FDFA5|nr:hypothetical protein [Xanthomonas hortorum]WCI07381.1 hypothetical protein PML25_23135 [Xanthomonas hortorum pv. pelargonii]
MNKTDRKEASAELATTTGQRIALRTTICTGVAGVAWWLAMNTYGIPSHAGSYIAAALAGALVSTFLHVLRIWK